MTVLFLIPLLTGCSTKEIEETKIPKPDEYYITQIRKKLQEAEKRNINCNVYTYSQTQMKAVCNYEWKCQMESNYWGNYTPEKWCFKTREEIYDIEYELTQKELDTLEQEESKQRK